MLLAFSGLMVASLLNGLDVDCGCAVPLASNRVGLTSLVRNASLLALLAWWFVATSSQSVADWLAALLSFLKQHPDVAVMRFVFVLMACQVVYLSQANQLLASRSAVRSLQQGDRVEPFSVRTPNGRDELISFEGHSLTTLVVFSAGCPFCEQDARAWVEQYQGLLPGSRMLGVSLSSEDETQAFAKKHQLPFPTRRPAHKVDFMEAYGIVGTPQKIEVSRDGTVRQNTIGSTGTPSGE